MLSETDPEMLRLLAPYQETIGRFTRKIEDMNAEFAEQQAARDKELAETLKRQQAESERIVAERAEQKRAAEEKAKAEGAAEQQANVNDAWRTPRRPDDSDMRFGPEDDDQVADPGGGWRPVPTPAQPMQRPSAPPARPSRAAARYDDDDEDMSGQSWMR